MAHDVGVNVRLSRGRPCDAVVDDLTAAGLTVERVLRSIDVVCGTVAADRLDSLAGIAGVDAVERDHVVTALGR